jgi:hypothetical protein
MRDQYGNYVVQVNEVLSVFNSVICLFQFFSVSSTFRKENSVKLLLLLSCLKRKRYEQPIFLWFISL